MNVEGQPVVTQWGYVVHRLDTMDSRIGRVERDLAVVAQTTITRKAVLASLVALAPIMAGAVTFAVMLGNALWGE